MKAFRVVILIMLISFALVTATPAEAANTYPDWQYRVPITIMNNLVDVLTDFQVKIVLNSTNFNWSHVRSDGADIRFALPNGTVIPYWIEEWDYTNQQAVIWIKVPELPSQGSTTVYMYYGNGAATSESDGNAVFEFFDDFKDLSNWNTQEGNPTISEGILSLPAVTALTSVQQINMSNMIVESLVKLDTNYRLTIGFNDRKVTYDVPGSKYGEWQLKDASETALSNFNGIDPSPGVWQIWRIEYGQNAINIYLDDTYVGSFSDSYRTLSQLSMKHWTAGTSYIDWVRVRKYAAQEPTVAIGAEEPNNQATVTFSFSDSLGNTVNSVNVYANGTLIGVFNNSDSITLSQGNYTFTFEKQGYQNVTKAVELINDTTISVVFTPTNPITLALNFKDDLGNVLNGVDIFINGKSYGTFNSGDSIMLATPGNYTIVAQKQHYISTQQTFNIQNDTTVTLTLDRESYLVYFYAYDYNNTEINAFDVYANGTKIGTFSSGGSTLIKYGSYVFKFSKNGYRSLTLPKTLINQPGIKVTFTGIMPNDIYAVSFNFYNAENNSMLNSVNVYKNGVFIGVFNNSDSITLSQGNYTFTFSKQGYESKTLSLELTSDVTMSIYIAPSTKSTTPEQPTYNLTPTNGTISLPSDYGFTGTKLGELFVQGKWSDVYTEFWHYDPLASIVLPILFSLGLIIAGFIYTRNPLVPIAVTAIMVTFFHLLGLSLNISLVAPLASIFVFFVVWVLWDFYKMFERS